MADSSHPLILDALRRAVADPAGMPLHGNKTHPGLFPGSTGAKKVARTCKERQYLQTVRTEQRGKSAVDICAITEQGLVFLMGETSPRQALADLVQALDEREREIAALAVAADRTRAHLDMLRATVDKVLHAIGTSPPVCPAPQPNGAREAAWMTAVVDFLAQWQADHPTEDCPLPELYAHARRTAPLTIGEFHDGLRHLCEQARVFLHPWTGPLYDIPDPTLALLVGHAIAYYASIRK